MHEHCHRCGGELGEGSELPPFCPHCSAPQLFLSADISAAAEPAGASSTGQLPPPKPSLLEWRSALRSAMLVAIAGAVLLLLSIRLPVFSVLSFLWAISGALITIGLYQRQHPTGRMNAAVGSRIGVTAGLCMALCLGMATAILGVVERYWLHAMGSFDAFLGQQMAAVIDHVAASNSLPPAIVQTLNAPEITTGILLVYMGMAALMLLVLSAVSGAVAGIVRTGRMGSA